MNDCIIWTGPLSSRGYGVVSKTKQLAHRAAYAMANGPFDNALCVLHKCDNPPCINPDHLFLGTRADNNRDRATKGRNGDKSGVISNRTKLTEEMVADIRIRAARGESRRHIREMYGMSKAQIRLIIIGRAWPLHLGPDTRREVLQRMKA